MSLPRLLVCSSLFLCLASAQNPLSNMGSVPVGSAPTATAVADFDRDGFLDLVVADSGSDDVRVIPGDGTRHFDQSRTKTYPVTKPYGLAVADFNGDGFLDIAVTSATAGAVTILLGDGKGGFTRPAWSPVNVGQGPRDIVAADFNGDGRPDLAVANFADGTVTILLWNASAANFHQAPGSPFKAGTAAGSAGSGTLSLAAADFDGDGKPDLAAAVSSDGTVAVFRGAGDGTFAPFSGSPYPLAGAYGIAAADFNRDGRLDLAATARASGTVQIFLGDGKGGFSPGTPKPVGNGSPQAIMAADFNGDGRADLAWVNNTSGNVGVLLGDGLGGFLIVPGAPAGPATSAPSSLAVADLNRDTQPDLLVAAQGNGNIYVLLNGTPGVPAASTTFAKKYVMAFMACPANCTGPVDRATRLVESDDGISWSYPSGLSSVFGSTPDVVFRGSKLYVYAAVPPMPNRVFRYSLNGGTWSAATVTIADSSGNVVNFVDPAAILDESGSIVLFFTLAYDAVGGISDPQCYPCENRIGSAVEVSGSDGTAFILQPGWRTTRTLSGPTQYLTDPSIFTDGQLFYLYTRFEGGTLVGTSTMLHGHYSPPLRLPSGVLTAAGDDSAGYYDAIRNEYWTYAGMFPAGIGRAVTSSVDQPIDAGKFTIAIPSPGLGLPASGVASPGFKENGFLQTTNAAGYAGPVVAPDSIAAAFGNRLSTDAKTGTRVTVRDSAGAARDAQLFYVSPTQVNYLVPADTALGPATVTILSADGISTVESVRVNRVAPGLFTASGDGQGVVAANALRLSADGSVSPVAVFQWNAALQKSVAVPIDLGAETDQVYLVLYGTGLRGATLNEAAATIGGVDAPVKYVGPQGEYPGFDQVNVILPRSLAGGGAVDIALTLAGKRSNVGRIVMK